MGIELFSSFSEICLERNRSEEQNLTSLCCGLEYVKVLTFHTLATATAMVALLSLPVVCVTYMSFSAV